jgi:hypothetical protein
MADELKDEWPRFFCHWLCVTGGFFLKSLLPVLKQWEDPTQAIAFPRWWAVLMFGAVISLVGGAINSNLPIKPRELVKSIGLGFALDSASVLAKIHT